MIRKIAIFIFSIYGFIVFLFWMFALLPLFIVAFFLSFPHNGNLVYSISRFWTKAFFFFLGIRYISSYQCELSKDTSYIFVSNHISYLDIPMMLLATKTHPVRILGKAEMGKIPVFGFIYKMGTVSVQRAIPEKRKQSVDQLMGLLEKDISILICPEGTFNMTRQPLKEFYDGAFRIATELQKPVVPILFPDTYERMNYRSIFSLTPGKCRAIILKPVFPDSGETAEALKVRVKKIMKAELENLKPSWTE